MKKFLLGMLMCFALMGGVTSEAYQELCCDNSGYYCSQDCNTYDGEYCGRYGCGR